MTPVISELVSDVVQSPPEASYSRRIGSGMAVLEAMIRDRGSLLVRSELAAGEYERLRRLQEEDKACRSSVRRRLERGELYLALETLLQNNIHC